MISQLDFLGVLIVIEEGQLGEQSPIIDIISRYFNPPRPIETISAHFSFKLKSNITA